MSEAAEAATLDITGAIPGPNARSIVVGAERRVVESTAPEIEVGALLTHSSWLGREMLDAIDAASSSGQWQVRSARDYARDKHWLVHATIASARPWQARVVAIDASLAVETDRAAVLGKIVHSSRNIGAALLSVLEALELDTPTGEELARYLGHLRDPAERLSTTMKHLAACFVSPALDLRDVTIGALVARALTQTEPSFRPRNHWLHDPALTSRLVTCDVELLSESIVAMLESGLEESLPTLDVSEALFRGKRCLRILVERLTPPLDERSIAGLWDLAGAQRAELPLRLSHARAIARAHGGDALAESAGAGRVRLCLFVPGIKGD